LPSKPNWNCYMSKLLRQALQPFIPGSAVASQKSCSRGASATLLFSPSSGEIFPWIYSEIPQASSSSCPQASSSSSRELSSSRSPQPPDELLAWRFGADPLLPFSGESLPLIYDPTYFVDTLRRDPAYEIEEEPATAATPMARSTSHVSF
jgi:hypothetical protein